MVIWTADGSKLKICIDAPQPAQLPFFKSRVRHTGYGGARGGGKSWAMRTKFVLLACRFPGLKLLLVRRTYKELEENHIQPLLQLLVPCGIAKYSEKRRAFEFLNNSVIKLGYCDSEKDVLQYQGQEYDVIGLEEATNFSEFQVKFLLTCNRSVREDFSARAYYTANPGGVGHAWYKRLFVDREYQGSEKPEDYVFFRACVDDNKYLRDTEYKQVLMDLPEDMRRAHLYGDWDVYMGQYFSEFRREKHIVEPFEIPSSWEHFRSLDYGQDMTACYWWAVDGDGRCFIYRELYEPDLTLSEAASEIVNLTPRAENIRYTVASPDLWNRRQETGFSGAELMSRAGLSGLVKARDNRINGWRALKEFLKHDRKDKNSIPLLRIFENCSNLIRTLPQLQYDRMRTEDVSREPHELTHAAESIRYGIMSRPKAADKGAVKKWVMPSAPGYCGDSADLFGFGGDFV